MIARSVRRWQAQLIVVALVQAGCSGGDTARTADTASRLAAPTTKVSKVNFGFSALVTRCSRPPAA